VFEAREGVCSRSRLQAGTPPFFWIVRPLNSPGGYGNSIQSRSSLARTYWALSTAGKTAEKRFSNRSIRTRSAAELGRIRQEAAATPAPPACCCPCRRSPGGTHQVSTRIRGPLGPIPPRPALARREALSKAGEACRHHQGATRPATLQPSRAASAAVVAHSTPSQVTPLLTAGRFARPSTAMPVMGWQQHHRNGPKRSARHPERAIGAGPSFEAQFQRRAQDQRSQLDPPVAALPVVRQSNPTSASRELAHRHPRSQSRPVLPAVGACNGVTARPAPRRSINKCRKPRTPLEVGAGETSRGQS